MTEHLEGCDPDAIRYDVHWRPVLDAPREALLDRLAERIDLPAECVDGLAERREGLVDPRDGALHEPVLLDVGTGTGGLLLSAARRWPTARLVGLDPSTGMLSVARRRAEQAGLTAPDRSPTWLAASAEAIPRADASVDVAMSAFVLQLVHDRATVLREMCRVLRPGGLVAAVTWLASGDRLPADDEFDEAVVDLGIDEPESEVEDREDDFESLDAAGLELTSAGFADVRAEPGELRHAWSRSGYLRFKEEYDEQHLFGSLDASVRDALVARVIERWAALPTDAFVFRHPVVSILAVRP